MKKTSKSNAKKSRPTREISIPQKIISYIRFSNDVDVLKRHLNNIKMYLYLGLALWITFVVFFNISIELFVVIPLVSYAMNIILVNNMEMQRDMLKRHYNIVEN